MSDAKDTFWQRFDNVRTGMLGIQGRHIPMTHYPEDESNRVFFLTAAGTDAHEAAVDKKEVHYLICSDKHGVYCDLKGRLELVPDRQKLDDVWNAFAAAWFEDGKTDDAVRLIKFTPVTGELWLSPDSNTAFLVEMVKSGLTGGKPDLGTHEMLRF